MSTTKRGCLSSVVQGLRRDVGGVLCCCWKVLVELLGGVGCALRFCWERLVSCWSVLVGGVVVLERGAVLETVCVSSSMTMSLG